MLIKYKEKRDITFALVYSKSTTKTGITFKYDIHKSSPDIYYRIDNWINERSGWVIQSINGEYVNISIYSTLPASSYIELSVKLKTSRKGLINIKKNYNKYFLWNQIRNLYTLKTQPEWITKANKNYCCKLKEKINIWINVFCYDNNSVYPVYISEQKFKALLIVDKRWKYMELSLYQRF